MNNTENENQPETIIPSEGVQKKKNFSFVFIVIAITLLTTVAVFFIGRMDNYPMTIIKISGSELSGLAILAVGLFKVDALKKTLRNIFLVSLSVAIFFLILSLIIIYTNAFNLLSKSPRIDYVFGYVSGFSFFYSVHAIILLLAVYIYKLFKKSQ